MRNEWKLWAAVPLVFAMTHTSISLVWLSAYTVKYFLLEPSGSFAAFLVDARFVSLYMVSLVFSAVLTAFFAVVAWISNAKSAKDRNRIETLIDRWVSSLSRGDR